MEKISSQDDLVKALNFHRFTRALSDSMGHTYNHILSVDVLYGEDDYETISQVHIDNNKNFISTEESIKTPNRMRGLGGVVITFGSEEGIKWTHTYLFHKGEVYVDSQVIDEDFDFGVISQ